MKQSFFIFSIFIFGFLSPIWSESIIQRTRKQYLLLTPLIQELEMSIQNIGTPKQKEYFKETKTLFEKGFKYYLSSYAPLPPNMLNKYDKTFIIFYKIQKRLETQLEILSQQYINDATTILDDISKSLLDLVVKYNEDSYLARILIKRDFNPELESSKPYNTKEVHRIADKNYLLRVLKIGFESVEQAKISRIEATNREAILLPEEKKSVFQYALINDRIKYFRRSILFSKQAKINAINAFKIYNQKLLYCAQKKYYDNPYFQEENIDPVFDPRIPSKYLAHANDVLNREHQEEVNIKIKQIYLASPVPAVECSYNYTDENRTALEKALYNLKTDTAETDTAEMDTAEMDTAKNDTVSPKPSTDQ